MSDKVKIIAGLVIFLALATLPFWYASCFSREAGRGGSPPELEPPAGAPLLFSTPWSAVHGDSEQDISWERLQKEFAEHQISLSADARLATGEQGSQWSKWRITDQQRRYLVVKSRETLTTYAGECVEDQDTMIGHHMDVLNGWRDAVVRRGDKGHVEINGKSYQKSLTKGCMACHTNRETFCYRCHEYADVLPLQPLQERTTARQPPRGIRCWDCHVEPKA